MKNFTTFALAALAATTASFATAAPAQANPLNSMLGNAILEQTIGMSQVDFKCQALSYSKAQEVGMTPWGETVYRCVGGGQAPSQPFTF